MVVHPRVEKNNAAMKMFVVSGVEVSFYDFRSEESMSMILQMLTEHFVLVPRWMHSIQIFYKNEEDPRGEMQAYCDLKYKYGQITVMSDVFKPGRTYPTVVESLVHELIHFSINPLVDYMKDQLEILMPDAPQYQSSIKKIIAEKLESAVCDLTDSYYRAKKSVAVGLHYKTESVCGAKI